MTLQMKITLKGSTLDKLDQLKEYLGIKKYEIVTIAFYNGIKSLEAGYIPYQPKEVNTTERKPIHINVPPELKETIKKFAKDLGYNIRDLLELVVELECNRLINMLERFNNKSFTDIIDDDNEIVKFSTEFKIPKDIHDKIYKNAKIMGMSDERQYFKYLLLIGLYSHENNIYPLTMKKSLMIAEEIKQLSLDPVKAWTLAYFIVQNSPENKLCDLETFLRDYLDTNKLKKAEEKRKQKKKGT